MLGEEHRKSTVDHLRAEPRLPRRKCSRISRRFREESLLIVTAAYDNGSLGHGSSVIGQIGQQIGMGHVDPGSVVPVTC